MSTLNSLYDPLGFVAPTVLQSSLMFRELMEMSNDWGDSLPSEYERQWQDWRDSLQDLEALEISRNMFPLH